MSSRTRGEFDLGEGQKKEFEMAKRLEIRVIEVKWEPHIREHTQAREKLRREGIPPRDWLFRFVFG